MNEILCSICLNPDKCYSDYFKNIIASLAKKYNTFSFSPHLTIYGVIRAPQGEIEEAINYAFTDIQKFSVNTIKLNYSDQFTKTLYIQLSKNNKLITINKRLSQKLSKYLINSKEYDLNPHISLIYKHGMSANEKVKIISSFTLKKEFVFDACSIITAPKPLEKEEDVKNFKEVYTQSF